MDAWILRFPKYRPFYDFPVVVLHVTPDGDESEVEVIDMELGPGSLRDLVQDQIEKGRRRLILDLSLLVRMDVSVLAEIVDAFIFTRDSGSELVLVNLDPRFQSILRPTRFDRVIPTLHSTEEAVSHFDS